MLAVTLEFTGVAFSISTFSTWYFPRARPGTTPSVGADAILGSIPDSLAELSPFQASGPPPPRGALTHAAPTRELIRRNHLMPSATRGWVETTVDTWIREGTYVSDRSRDAYRRRASMVPTYLAAIGFNPPPTSVDAFRRDHIDALRCRGVSTSGPHAGERMSPKQLSVVMSALRQLLGFWAERRGSRDLVRLVADRRLWSVRDPQPIRPARSLSSPEDLDRLVASCDERVRVGAVLGGHCGLRIAEIAAVEVRDLELCLDRPSWVTVRSGKGSKPRRAPIPPCARNLLMAAVHDRAPTERLLSLGVDAFRRGLARAGRRAGIGHVYPHRLRATFITFALRSGAIEQVVMDWAGHEKYETTRGYSRHDPELEGLALRRFEAYLDGRVA